jgi:hypothetical protein
LYVLHLEGLANAVAIGVSFLFATLAAGDAQVLQLMDLWGRRVDEKVGD